MTDMNRYFDLNAENPSAHWFSAASDQNFACSPSRNSYFNQGKHFERLLSYFSSNILSEFYQNRERCIFSDSVMSNSLNDDPGYRKKMEEFENTVQEKLREEMRGEES